MPDWKSLEELQKDAAVFVKFMHALLGLYAYEWFISLDFDWDFLTGKKRFRWPMIFYFANRYLLLFAMIGIAIALDTTTEIDCQSLYTFNQLAGDAAVGLASINLSIRTMAVWSQNRWIIGFLVIVILGHWSLILQGVLLKAVWVDGTGCVITQTDNTILAATFIYSMCFDFIVFLLNAYKLLGVGSASGSGLVASRVGKMIFEDGLIFFFVAFLVNLLASVFMILDLNQIMSVIFNVPAAVFSTIVACRAVRRLTNFANQGPEVYAVSTSQSGGNVQFRATPTGRAGPLGTINTSKYGTKSGVHVQMETFSRAEDPTHLDLEYNHYEEKMAREAMTPAQRALQSLTRPPRDGSDTDVELDIESKGQHL